MKKIALIKPRIGRQEFDLYIEEGRMEPLQLAVIAGMTPEHIEVVMYDDRFEEIEYDDKVDLVAITVETYTARRSYEISMEYRKRGVPVILGGMHVTLIPEEAKEYADSIMTGDAGWMWNEVINDMIEYKKLKPHYKSKVGAPQLNKFMPDRSIYEDKEYLDVALIQFGRGCKFACSFCAIATFFDNQQYYRSFDQVAKEMKAANKKFFFFVDDNICADIEALKDLCRRLIPLKIKWVSQGSLDMTKDHELMELMVKSGCIGNVMGFETINKGNARQLRKAPNFFRKEFNLYHREIQELRRVGLQTWASFTLGYDHDTRDSILETVDYAIKQKFCFGAFNILVPYPNTDFYRMLKEQNRLLFDDKWWLHPSYKFNHCSFKPKNMTPDQLTEISFECKRRWNSWKSVISRYFDLKTHMRNPIRSYVYWKYNPIYKGENHRKQSMYFGLYNHINDDGKLIHAKENLGITPHMKIENQEKIIINPTPEAELLTT